MLTPKSFFSALECHHVACLPFRAQPTCHYGLEFPECHRCLTLHQFQVIHLLHHLTHTHTLLTLIHSPTLSLVTHSLLSSHHQMDTNANLLVNDLIPWTVFAGPWSLPLLSYSSRTLVKFFKCTMLFCKVHLSLLV